ncbi:hypothetical protein F1880_008086 [Penicillium rolfsii]|nr:hypothetical protein F1880_008086 [Penicillium rolfsii]
MSNQTPAEPAGFLGGFARDVMSSFVVVNPSDSQPWPPILAAPAVLQKFKFYLGTFGAAMLVLVLAYVSAFEVP